MASSWKWSMFDRPQGSTPKNINTTQKNPFCEGYSRGAKHTLLLTPLKSLWK